MRFLYIPYLTKQFYLVAKNFSPKIVEKLLFAIKLCTSLTCAKLEVASLKSLSSTISQMRVKSTISNTRATFAYYSFCDNLRLKCTSQSVVIVCCHFYTI